jgi:hypothetical protein
VVFQRWREESAKRNGVLLALKSAFIEENDARRLRAAFRVWRQRAMEMKAKSAWQSSRTPAIAASMSPLKKKTSAKDERNSPKSTASSWDFDVDFEQNARNLKLTNTTFKSMSRKATGTFFGADNTNNRNGRDENTNTNNSSSSRFSALDRSYRETIDACIALEAKLEMKGSATRTSSQYVTPRKDASSSTVPTTRESREFKQNALKEKLMDIEASAMALLESARATRVRREKLHQQQQQAQSSF